MLQTDKEKVRQVSNNLNLARYWGTEGETVLNAIELARKNPGMSAADALRASFEGTKKSMEPMAASN